MKKLAAIFFSILFLFLCGCEKSAAEYLSDINGFLKRDPDSYYNEIIEKAESLGKNILSTVEKNSIEQKDIIKIKPHTLNDEIGELYAYSKLNQYQKNLYYIMLTAVKDLELRIIDVTNYVTGDGFSDCVIAHRAVLCDNPDIFWMPKTFSLLSVEGKKDKYLCFRNYYAEEDDIGFYGITKSQKTQMQSELDKITSGILNRAEAYNDTFEKELFFHDYLCENIEYDIEAAEDLENSNTQSITVYGALVNGKAICEGYSKAMQTLCKMANIPCNVVYGEHEGVAHMWNIIDLYGELYYLDATFDDSSSETVMHIYFNLTKDQISKDHIFYDEILLNQTYDNTADFNFFNYECSNTAFNYFEKKNAYITEDFSLAEAAILNAQAEGKNSIELKNTTSLSPSSAFKRLKHKIGKTVDLKYCYQYDNENILIAVW